MKWVGERRLLRVRLPSVTPSMYLPVPKRLVWLSPAREMAWHGALTPPPGAIVAGFEQTKITPGKLPNSYCTLRFVTLPHAAAGPMRLPMIDVLSLNPKIQGGGADAADRQEPVESPRRCARSFNLLA